MKATDSSAARRGNAFPLSRFAAYVAVACGIVAVFLLSWKLRDVVLMAFGAIIVAVIIRSLARPLIARTGIKERWAIAIVVVLLAVLLLGASWLFGQQITAQLRGVSERLPQAIKQVQTWLETSPAGGFVVEKIEDLMEGEGWLERFQTLFTISVATIAHALLMLFAGIYLASNPRLYRDGFVRLFPTRYRPRLQGALGESGEALRKWLIGQIVSMVSVGTLTGLGLWAVGAPLPLALGIVAGLLEFVPVVGPVIAIVPGVLVAITEGPQVALYAAIVYVIVQQLEGNVIMPIAQRWAVELPPAYGLISLVAFGLLFGFLGIFFGSPLAVVVMCLVQTLYVEEGLEKRPKRELPVAN
jgi:predicted PurR-regulated permease PerM